MNEVISSERIPPSEPGTFPSVNIYEPNSLEVKNKYARVSPGLLSLISGKKHKQLKVYKVLIFLIKDGTCGQGVTPAGQPSVAPMGHNIVIGKLMPIRIEHRHANFRNSVFALAIL